MPDDQPDDQVTNFRRWNLALAESMDAWRVVPRLLVAAYGYLTWEVVKWYMNIEAKIIPCVIANAAKVCAEPGMTEPTTQQAALVTVVVGAAAGVFAFYTNTGRDWSKTIIPFSKKSSETKTDEVKEGEVK